MDQAKVPSVQLASKGVDLIALARRAIRAAKFEEMPATIWRKILPTIPEGVSTTRASEMHSWARSLILDRELAKGIPEALAIENTARMLLADNVY